MRIASATIIALVLLGGLSLFLSAERLWNAHLLLQQDRQLAGLAQAKSQWYEGTVALSFERSVTQVAFALESAITSDFRTIINQQRKQSDALLQQAVNGLADKASFENRAVFMEHINKARAGITDLREEADALLALPKAARNPRRATALPYEIKSQIEILYSAATFLVLPEGNSSTQEMLLNRIQSLAWEIREYGGRARTFYAVAALTGEPIPQEQTGEAFTDNARIKAGWHQLLSAARAAELPPVLAQRLTDVAAPFVEAYLPSLDLMDRAMAEQRAGTATPMPYSFNDFFTLSNTGLDAIAGIAPFTGDLIQDYWAAEVAAANNIRIISALQMLGVICLTLVSLWALHTKMIRPLKEATSVLQDLSDGNLERNFRVEPRGLDELRVIWDALDRLTKTLQQNRAEAAREHEAEQRAKEGIVGALMTGLEKMAQGNLIHQIPNDFGPAYAPLVMNYNTTSNTLRTLVTEVIMNASEISRQSAELRTAIADLSGRTEAQADSVLQTVGKLGNLSSNITDMAQSAGRSDEFVCKATQTAQQSGETVSNAVTAMGLIKSSSQEIGKFTAVIDEIAFQTSLLALNAGVEAARAGEAGKGFAIVATEVRNLAQRATESASEIKKVIDQSLKQVETGAQDVMRTGDSFEEITKVVLNIRSSIDEISAAYHEQTARVSEIGSSMDILTDTTRQNASMVDQVTVTGGMLEKNAHALRTAVDRFIVTPALQNGIQRQRV